MLFCYLTTLTTLSLHHHQHHLFLPNLPQIIHNRVRDEKIYRFVNSVVVVVVASWRYGRHSHLVCTRSMFAVRLYVFGSFVETFCFYSRRLDTRSEDVELYSKHTTNAYKMRMTTITPRRNHHHHDTIYKSIDLIIANSIIYNLW